MRESEKVAEWAVAAGWTASEVEFLVEVVETFDAVVVGSEEDGTGWTGETWESRPASNAAESDGSQEEAKKKPGVRPSLDYYKHNRNRRRCGCVSVTGPVVDGEKELQGYARVDCKAWSCPRCGPKKAAALCRRIALKAKEHGLSRFLTLTLDPKELPKTEDLVVYIRRVWSKFRVYLARKYGQRVSYIAVLEHHKSGIPHLHVLIDRYIPQGWISEAWSTLGGGRIVFIEQVKDLEKIGWYLGKYLTKEAMLSGDSGRRRFSCSRDVKLGDMRPKTGWKWMRVPVEWLRNRAGDGVVHEVRDEEGRLKSFATEEKLAGATRPVEA